MLVLVGRVGRASRAGGYRKASPVTSGRKEYRFVKEKKKKEIYSKNLATDVISVIGNCRVLSTAKALLN